MGGRRESPACQQARTWLKDKHGPRVFAPFTGQDSRAFSVFVHALELYAGADDDGRAGALLAMRGALLGMQHSTRALAKAAIPAILDYDDIETLWPQIPAAQSASRRVADAAELLARGELQAPLQLTTQQIEALERAHHCGGRYTPIGLQEERIARELVHLELLEDVGFPRFPITPRGRQAILAMTGELRP